MAFFFNQNAYALRLSLDKNYTYDSQNISLLPVKLHRPNSNTLALDYAYDTRTSTLDYRTTLKLNRNCNILYSPTPYCIIFLIFSYNYDASPKQYDSISPHNAYDANSDDFRARYYSTELGQFISRDPLEYVDGMNMYSGYFARRFGMDPSGKKGCRQDTPPAAPQNNQQSNTVSFKQEGAHLVKTEAEKIIEGLQKERDNLIKELTKGGVEATKESGCKIVSVIIELPAVGESIGHTGISVDNFYFDLGPSGDNPWGNSPAQNWWSGKFNDLDDLIGSNFANQIEKSADVFQIDISVCGAEAKKIEDFWHDLNSKMSQQKLNYSLVFKGYHCTTSVAHSLNIGLETSFTGTSPQTLLQQEIGTLKHTCGKNKGKNVKIKHIFRGK